MSAAYFRGAIPALAEAVIQARSKEKWDAFVRDCNMEEREGTWDDGLKQLD